MQDDTHSGLEHLVKGKSYGYGRYLAHTATFSIVPLSHLSEVESSHIIRSGIPFSNGVVIATLEPAKEIDAYDCLASSALVWKQFRDSGESPRVFSFPDPKRLLDIHYVCRNRGIDYDLTPYRENGKQVCPKEKVEITQEAILERLTEGTTINLATGALFSSKKIANDKYVVTSATVQIEDDDEFRLHPVLRYDIIIYENGLPVFIDRYRIYGDVSTIKLFTEIQKSVLFEERVLHYKRQTVSLEKNGNGRPTYKKGESREYERLTESIFEDDKRALSALLYKTVKTLRER